MDQEKVWDEIAEQWYHFRQQKSRPVYDFIEKYKPKKGRILEIGCGNSRNLIPFAKLNFECYGIDFSKNMIKGSEKLMKKHNLKVKFKKANMINLPYKNNYFDYILNIDSFHLLQTEEKRIKALKESYRVLKPNGLMLLTAWNKLQLSFLFKPKDNFIPWTKKGVRFERFYHFFYYFELKKLIERTKFKILKSNIFGKKLIFVLKK